MKRRLIIAVCVVLFLSVVLVASLNFLDFLDFFNDPGVRTISASQRMNGEILLKIEYFSMNGALTRNFDINKQIYRGEQLVNIDPEIGRSVVNIELFDAEASRLFESKYTQYTVYTLKQYENYRLNFMWCYNSDHGMSLYIGSDENIFVEQKKYSDIREWGSLGIVIHVE